MASPSPVPSGRVVKKGSHTVGRISGGMPPPESLISMTTPFAPTPAPSGRVAISSRPPSGMASSAFDTISVNACSSRIGSTRISGSAAAWFIANSTRRWRSNSERAEGGGPGERQQVSDPEIETIDLLDDGTQLLAGGGGFDPVLGELRGRAQARQRVPQPVGHRCRHLPDRGQLLGLHELGAGLTEPLGHLREGAGEVADLVARPRLYRMVQVARTNHGHGLPQLADRTRQTPGNQPRSDEAHDQREHDD